LHINLTVKGSIVIYSSIILIETRIRNYSHRTISALLHYHINTVISVCQKQIVHAISN